MPTSGSRAFPAEFDAGYYRAQYADLASMDDATLLLHWNSYGIAEGRCASPAARRAQFTKLIQAQPSVLEIGPFYSPTVSGPSVSYFDVMSTEALVERAKSIGQSPAKVPRIDWVSWNGDLGVVDRSFDAVVSSHCIEHQPDLIRHLRDVRRLLNDGGSYFLIIPDKRYCFDHMLPASGVESVIAAQGATVHGLKNVIEHRALTTHNDAARHWRGDHFDDGFQYTIPQRVEAAMREHAGAAGGYVDVHAWQFSPESFAALIRELASRNLIGFSLQRVYQTPHGQLEFCGILAKA